MIHFTEVSVQAKERQTKQTYLGSPSHMVQRGDQLNPCSLISEDESVGSGTRISRAFSTSTWEAALDLSAGTAS